MGFCQSIDRTQLFNLLTGMGGIYILYFIAGILHESIAKRPHYNRFTSNYEICTNTAGLVLLPYIIGWIMALAYNKIFLKERVVIPHKNSAMTAFAVLAATYFSLLAIQRTSFPVVIMFESCSILPVVFIGVFCSRVHDPNLHLGPKKIIVALIIAAGILTFQFADPETRQRQFKQQFIGIVFLLFHFVAEGFLPDLQAQIKVNYKPQPTEMMSDINKWCSIFAILVSLVTWTLWDFIQFMWAHFTFSVDLIIMSIMSGFGQFFVYRMIKQFKQHFVPFTISSRKILTATISIVFYGHRTNWVQIMGIAVVLFTVFVQFMMEISKKPQAPPATANEGPHQLNEQKLQQQLKPSQDGSSKSVESKLNEQSIKQRQQQSIRMETANYNHKNTIDVRQLKEEKPSQNERNENEQKQQMEQQKQSHQQNTNNNENGKTEQVEIVDEVEIEGAEPSQEVHARQNNKI